MKTIIAISAVLFAANAQADFSGKYTKQNGEIVIRQKGQSADFSLTSIAGMGGFPTTCGLEGKLVMMDADRATYTSPEKGDSCAMVLKFAGDDLEVNTKNCSSACAERAIGTMDGAYRKKRVNK